jgi:hypothetical protein
MVQEENFGEEQWSDDSEEASSVQESDKDEVKQGVEIPASKNLYDVPVDWTGWTKANKVQYLVEVIQNYIQKVRSGNFDVSKSEALAALCLEAQIELTDFYAEAESYARDAKNLVEYTEGEVSEDILKESLGSSEKKLSEAALKRQATVTKKVLEAKKSMIMLEKEHKKCRYIYEMLQNAHVFFRNLGRV